MTTPRQLGYYFPAEWKKHAATWLSWPHKEASWPGKIDKIFPVYSEFVKIIAKGEPVCININNEQMKQKAQKHLSDAGVDLSKIQFYNHPTNDAWCRDHGPAFLLKNPEINPHLPSKTIVEWEYNAWGNKYPPFDLDNQIPSAIARHYNIKSFQPKMIMEGGSVDFNGKGTVLTTKSCLLNPNRNPHLNQQQIETYLRNYYGVEQILWLENGIEGDDTDGHIDDLTRFVNEDSVVTIIPEDKNHPDYQVLQANLKALKKMRLMNGKQLNIIELPVPSPYVEENQILPCSYANFYICNAAVIVPTFQDKEDEKALKIIESCFKDRPVVGLNSKDIIWGLGSFHCLSQQEPADTIN